jgi:acyl CoA:acetate/3-ketoacid CoA transferase beta subunit
VEVVDHIATELAFIDVTPEGLVLQELAADATLEQVQSLTEPKLIIPSGGPKVMPV